MDVMFIQASYFVFLTLANAADNSSSDEFIRFRKKTKSDFRKKDSQYSDFWDLEIVQVILYVKERKFKLFKDIYEDFICAYYEFEIYGWLRNKLVPNEIPQVDETEVPFHCDGTNCTWHAKLLKKKSNVKNKKIEKFVNKMQRRVLRIQKAAMNDCEDFIFDSSDEVISKSSDKSSDEVNSESSDNSSCSDCKRVHRCKIGNYPGVDMEKFCKEMAAIDKEIRQDSDEGFYYQSDKRCNCATKYLDNIAIIIEYIIIIHIGTLKYLHKITSNLTRNFFIRSQKPITQTEHAEILQDFTDFSSDLCVIVAKKLDIFKNISNRLIDILRSKYLDNAVLCDMNDSPDDKQKIKHNGDVKAIEQKENPHIQNTVSTMTKKIELQKTVSDANKKLVYYLPTSLYGHYDDFEGVFSNFENKLLQHSADTCIEFDEKPENFSPFYNAYEDFAGCYDDDCYNDFKTLVENAQEIGKSITIEEVVKMRERKPFLLNRSNLFLVKSIEKLNMDCMEVLSRLFNSKEKCLDTNGIREITIETMIDMANAIITRTQKLRNKLDRTYYTDYDFIIDLMKKFCADIIDSCKKTSKIPADSDDTFEYVVSCKLMCVSFYIKGIRPIWRCCRGNARSIPRRMIQNSNAFTDPNKAKDVIELNGENTTYDTTFTSNKGKFPQCDMNINPENIIDASTNDSDDTFYNEESSSICNGKENNFGKNKSSNDSKNTQFYLYISCLLFISMICSLLLWYKGKNNK